MKGRMVFVGRVEPANCAPARLAALGGWQPVVKLVDGVLAENPFVGAYVDEAHALGLTVHGWGVHHVGDDHARSLTIAAAACRAFGLASYGLDIEYGWFYDGDTLGWGAAHQGQEWSAYELEQELLLAAREAFGEEFQLWVTITPQKDYGPGVFAAAQVGIVPQLYGAADPFTVEGAAAAWADTVSRYYATAELGLPIVPALWKAQPWAGADKVVFLADAMDDQDLRDAA